MPVRYLEYGQDHHHSLHGFTLTGIADGPVKVTSDVIRKALVGINEVHVHPVHERCQRSA